MPTVLIDTDLAIDYLRGMQYAKRVLVPLWENNISFLSILTVYEMYAGMQDEERRDTSDFINACNIEPVTMEIAIKGGDLYRYYRKKGITITSIDCLIAATADVSGHKIATRNVKHYPNKKILYKFKV
jgi:hypothetical protein